MFKRLWLDRLFWLGVAWWVYILSILGAVLLCESAVMTYRWWLVKQLKNELRYEVFEEVKSQLGERIQNQHKESSTLYDQHPLSSNKSSNFTSTATQVNAMSAIEIPSCNRYVV